MKPNGDLAIANGIMHLLVKNGTWDKDFVEKHVAFRGASDPPTLNGKAIDFAAFTAGLDKYTPAFVEEVSGVPAADIEIRASWSPTNDDLQAHVHAWCALLASTAGLPPPGVTALHP